MSKNTIKYEYTKGCPLDVLIPGIQQVYKDKNGKMISQKHLAVNVQHNESAILLKVGKHTAYREAGKIIKREVVKAKVNDEPIH